MVLKMGRGVYSALAAAGDDWSNKYDMPGYLAKDRLRQVARIHAVTLASGRLEQAEQVAHLLLHDDDHGLGRIALVEASLELKTTPPTDASRWLDEARALGADVQKVRDRLAKVSTAQAK
jgi:hypothetical protein